MSSCFGSLLRKTLSEVTDFLSSERLDASLRLYVSDLNSFFIVANDSMTQEDFMNAMRMMFVKFNKISIKDNIVCFCSFYLVLNDTDLLENARLVMTPFAFSCRMSSTAACSLSRLAVPLPMAMCSTP